MERFCQRPPSSSPKLFLESNGQPKPAHLHMLRDTFAVEYLLAGMSLEEVSRLLGHSSVLITQKHYAPWVLQRQQHLVASQRKAWVNMGLEEKHHGPKMTRKYRPRKARRRTSFHDRRSGSAARGRQ